MSWVVGVGVGRGYVWVNVMGEKRLSKKIKNRKGEKVVKFMKRKSPRTYHESYSPTLRSAEEISQSFISTNGH